mgnify:CR=1 FL=1
MGDETQDLTAGYSNKPKIYVSNGQPYRNTVASIAIGLKVNDYGRMPLVDFSRVRMIERHSLERSSDYKTVVDISPEVGEAIMNVLWSAGVLPEPVGVREFWRVICPNGHVDEDDSREGAIETVLAVCEPGGESGFIEHVREIVTNREEVKP